MLQRFTEIIIVPFSVHMATALALVPIGFFLFFQAFPSLYWNETKTPLATQAAGAEIADPHNAAPYEGRFVSVTGPLTSDCGVGDADFLAAGPWGVLVRQVETFAWTETITDSERRRFGGSKRIEREWTYHMDWVSEVTPPEQMEHPKGHENPPPRFQTQVLAGANPRIGEVGLPLDFALGLPFEPLHLDRGDVRLIGEGSRAERYGDALFIGMGTPDTPAIGDQLVRFYIVPHSATITAFGGLRAGAMEPHRWEGAPSLLLALGGERDEAIAMISAADSAILWFVRGAGLLAIWLGLFLMLSPLFAVFDIVPPLGGLLRIVIGLVLLIPTFGLGLLTIGVAQVANSPPAMVIFGTVGAYLVYARFRMWREQLVRNA